MPTVNCDPTVLPETAACFACLTKKQARAVQTYLLAVIAGGSLDPIALARAAACFQCLTPEQTEAVQTYLLCQISNA